MTGTLSVQKIQGLASSATPTTVEIASGHKISGAAGSIVAPGHTLQVVNHFDGSVASTSLTIPVDDSTPLKTEGGEFMTLAITPKSSSNKLLIQVTVYGSANDGNRQITAALFQDDTTDALTGAGFYQPTGTGMVHLAFNHFMTAGTTSATTFKVRVGAHSGTFTFNGYNSSTQTMNGIGNSTITITEIAG